MSHEVTKIGFFFVTLSPQGVLYFNNKAYYKVKIELYWILRTGLFTLGCVKETHFAGSIETLCVYICEHRVDRQMFYTLYFTDYNIRVFFNIQHVLWLFFFLCLSIKFSCATPAVTGKYTITLYDHNGKNSHASISVVGVIRQEKLLAKLITRSHH